MKVFNPRSTSARRLVDMPMRAALTLLALTVPLQSQNPAPRAFDVASVKLHTGPRKIGITTSGPRWTAEAERRPVCG